MRHLLNDLRALEQIVSSGMIESGVRRIGAEQEMFLVDSSWRPAPAAMKLLPEIDDPHFTTELGLFNLEINLDPYAFGDDCLSRMEQQLETLLDKAREVAARSQLEVVLTGILPTIRKSDLDLDNMTPLDRYKALNDAMNRLRGGAYELRIKGLDELLLKHDSVMLESCNASFQFHFQVGADEFANLDNIAQAVAGPVIAAATNSPLLFGRQLWRETRIALFMQAVDTRSSSHHLRDRSPRVTFGTRWVDRSVVELFREDVARFRTLVGGELDEDPFAVLAAGRAPELKALRLHNSTVYRWNRACYGITGGKPHLRIENRVLPSGPTVIDEVANAAFWFGLISALSSTYEDITEVMAFDDAAVSFHAAARYGLRAELNWLGGETMPAHELILKRLLPLAREGLESRQIRGADVERYLDVIEHRVRTRRTGSDWLVTSLADMKGKGTPGERLNALTAATVARQKSNVPAADWERARLDEAGGWKHNFLKIEQFMTTDLFTVTEDEPMDLVASLMEWERIRHVPVEDHQNRLVGLISYRSLLRLLAKGGVGTEGAHTAVSEIMHRTPLTVSPETSTLDAIELMRRHRVGCLPVVKDGRLVGIVSERDFMNVAAELMEEKLRE
jgi:CBS domain-containing protein/gamma-glutamylcysteine synthetase